MARQVLFFVISVGIIAVLGMGCETAANNDDDNGGPSSTENGGSTPSGDPCDEFCEGVVSTCPEEDTMDTCLHSCEEAPNEPDEDALECAEAATSCSDIHLCWTSLYAE